MLQETDKITHLRELNFETYLKELAHKKVSVMISKLDDEVIQLWTKNHWSQIDPYSDLEEVNSEITTSPSSEESDHQPVLENMISVGGHSLRQRKRMYTLNQPHRASAHSFCRDMCHYKARQKPALNIGLKSASHARIQAQNKIKEMNKRKLRGELVNNRLVRSYALFQLIRKSPPKSPPPEAFELPDENSDNDATIILPITEPSTSKERTIVCSVKTTTFGIRKHVAPKKVHYY